MLARVGGIFGSAAADATAGYQIVASCLRPSSKATSARQYAVFAISEKMIARWQIADDGSYQFVEEADLYDTLVGQTIAAAQQAGRSLEGIANLSILDAKARG